ncbi:MAG TPA: hypothetical protein VK730_02670 [Solirubrobacteraceae bacterium]|jgi:hypothetical protein|nr:hypothetical protein [Solirubrobacteraceae bacterium]
MFKRLMPVFLVVCVSLVVTAPANALVSHQLLSKFDEVEGVLFAVAVDNSGGPSNGDVYVASATAIEKFDGNGTSTGVQITGGETPGGSFHIPVQGVAVDNSVNSPNRDDVYVADVANEVIDKFGEKGEYLCQITAAAVPSSSECDIGGSGIPTESILPASVAVAPNGNLYASDAENNLIDEFGPSGEYLTRIVGPGQTTIDPHSLAIDGNGDLYVSDSAGVAEFNAKGEYVSMLDENQAFSMAIDPSSPTGPIYVSEKDPADQIVEYSHSGQRLTIFGSGGPQPSLAVSASTGNVYATSAGAGVYIYSRPIITPNLTTQPATTVQETSATLNAQVEPDVAGGGGEITSCQFEYGTSTSYGQTAHCSPEPPYAGSTNVSASVTGLSSDTEYHYRISAGDTASPSNKGSGEDKTIITSGPPSIKSESSGKTTGTSSEVGVEIDPFDLATSCRVQYVDEEQFRASGYDGATTVGCTPESLQASFETSAASAQFTGLHLDTTYHYRFIVANSAAPEGVVGSDETFSTFGVQSFSIGAFGPAAEVDALAGSHPYELTTTFAFPTTIVSGRGASAEANPRDIEVELPPGLIGNPNAVAKCSAYNVAHADCSGATQVGVLTIYTAGRPLGEGGIPSPIYNLVPPGGVAAQFGGRFNGFVTADIEAKIRTGSDYGITADSLYVSTAEGLTGATIRMWGVPSDPSHDLERYCPAPGKVNEETGPGGPTSYYPYGPCTERGPSIPFLRNPTSCSGPRTASAHVDGWQEPGVFVGKSGEMPAVTECGKLRFEPTLEAQPTSSVADSPSGLNVDLHVPQPEGCKEEAGKVQCELGEADLKDAKVVLPPGLVVNPSSADGLEACSEAQIGYLPGKSAEVGTAQFTPEQGQCPDGSKLGTVEIDSPLVDHPLPGGVYLAAQDANPFKSLLALYIAVYDPATGVIVKLPGRVTADQGTGQLTTTFENNPQLPFNDFKLDFFSSATRAPLTTPFVCGSYSLASVLTPWSAPEGADATPSSAAFAVTGRNGGSCVKSEGEAPNAPVFEAGTASPIGGSYSPFVLHLKREDASQHFSGLNVTLPPGMTGKIAGLQQCSQGAIEAAQARSHEGEGAVELSHPSCPAGSEVGVVHVGAGSGAPYYVTGHAYFAGPYKGAPFSLVIVTPALDGSFDLGTVVVRGALYINPTTAQVTVKSDPFPSILFGIPLDIRNIDVDINRGEFTLNPTSCATLAVSGEEPSTAGNTAVLSDRFQAGGCTTLPFHPSLSASSSGKTSRKEGASLVVHVGSGAGQANIAKVHVELPKQLPSRLETLKLACTESVFAANPASCPAGSAVGTAVARTPILNSPLSGPAYIVSHGGAAFPDLEVVLQGEGVTIVLDGKTNIENGITSSSFESVPDVPVSSFELKLPEGPHSILGAPSGLCSTHTVLVKKKVTVNVKRRGRVQKRRVTREVSTQVATGLVMPTTITGQNGAVIDQKTPIAVTGCQAVAVKHKTVKKHKSVKKHKTVKKHKSVKNKRGK